MLPGLQELRGPTPGPVKINFSTSGQLRSAAILLMGDNKIEWVYRVKECTAARSC